MMNPPSYHVQYVMREIRKKLQECSVGPTGVLIAYKGPLERGDRPRNMRFDIKLKGEHFGAATAEIKTGGLLHIQIYPKELRLKGVQFDLPYFT